MKEKDLYWVVGLLEGEGSFLLKKKADSAIIQCNMTDLDILKRLCNLAGGGICKIKKRESHWKQSWYWYLHGKKALNLMKKLEPLMGSRRKSKIQECIKIYEDVLDKKRIKSEKIEKMREEVKIKAASGKKHREIAKEYGKSRSYISHIVAGHYD